MLLGAMTLTTGAVVEGAGGAVVVVGGTVVVVVVVVAVVVVVDRGVKSGTSTGLRGMVVVLVD